MHWYKKNIGDYHTKAGRLSMLEHGAYTLLMDSCYDREAFPTREQAIEWTWATTKEEIEAVDCVLHRFFIVTSESIYEQPRILEEIEKYQSNSATNKRIANERETKRRGNPTKREQPVNEPCGNGHEAPPNQELVTSNQELSPLKSPKGESREKAKSVLIKLNEISGRTFKPVDSNLSMIMARIDDGHNAQDFAMVLSHQWAEWAGTNNMKYYRPSTLFRPSKFEGYLNDSRDVHRVKTAPDLTSSRTRTIEQDLLDTSWAD
jgi:uncharacterized phage protein (TIGR02220 family)